MFSRWENFLVVLIMAEILTMSSLFVLNNENYFTGRPAGSSINLTAAVINPLFSLTPVPPPQKLSNPPEIVKAVYVTGYSAGSKKYLAYLSNFFKTTEINAVVVDIKDYSGLISYDSGAPLVKKYKFYDRAIGDINTLVNFFHSQNIYVIGRITVFEDSAFAKVRPDLAIYDKAKTTLSTGSGQAGRVLWQDNNGLHWLDPSSKEVWDYNVSLAKDAFSHGFDEINFDYIRFPSDGNLKNMGFPVWDGKLSKAGVIKGFFVYLRQELKDDPTSDPKGTPASTGRGKISVDLFGQTTSDMGDMGIGQVIENAFENFDYISPMVYPSHYATGFLGFANPAEHPYEVVKYSMASALSRELVYLVNKQKLIQPSLSPATSPVPVVNYLAKFRPWLQDFSMGAIYNADMVKAEIKATKDALGKDFNGFMLWNASNKYTTGAVLKPK